MRIRPKVLHIITRLDMGGSAQNTLLTCKGLSSKYEMILAHGPSIESNMSAVHQQILEDQVKSAQQEGVRFLRVPDLVRRIDPFRDLCAGITLLKYIRREKPALVHTHSSKAGIVGRLAAWLAGVQLIVHTPHGHVFYGHFGPAISRLFLILERIFDRLTDRLIALTGGERKDYLALSVSRSKKIDIIHSGVDVDRFAPGGTDIAGLKKQLGLGADSPVIGTIGWLQPVKGPEVLLDAMLSLWAKKNDAQLVYVGQGELETKLREKVSACGVQDRVFFLGWRSDVHHIIQLFDLFVLPSLNEGMGRVLVEAMAAAKPIVASNTGGIPDLVKHEVNGFLTKPGDARDLSFHIERLLNDAQLRSIMGKRGQAMAGDYSIKKMVAKMEALYFSLFQQYTL